MRAPAELCTRSSLTPPSFTSLQIGQIYDIMLARMTTAIYVNKKMLAQRCEDSWLLATLTMRVIKDEFVP